MYCRNNAEFFDRLNTLSLSKVKIYLLHYSKKECNALQIMRTFYLTSIYILNLCRDHHSLCLSKLMFSGLREIELYNKPNFITFYILFCAGCTSGYEIWICLSNLFFRKCQITLLLTKPKSELVYLCLYFLTSSWHHPSAYRCCWFIYLFLNVNKNALVNVTTTGNICGNELFWNVKVFYWLHSKYMCVYIHI